MAETVVTGSETNQAGQRVLSKAVGDKSRIRNVIGTDRICQMALFTPPFRVDKGAAVLHFRSPTSHWVFTIHSPHALSIRYTPKNSTALHKSPLGRDLPSKNARSRLSLEMDRAHWKSVITQSLQRKGRIESEGPTI